MLEDWLMPLRRGISKEFADRPCVLCLATVGLDQTARARMVVLRRVDDSGSMWFVSDQRSGKNGEISATSRVEAVAWLASLREQFRLRGSVEIVQTQIRQEIWGELTDATRAMFFWPAPGEPWTGTEEFARGKEKQVDLPQSFSVLRMNIDEVERLRLEPFPHERTSWARRDGWTPVRLNP